MKRINVLNKLRSVDRHFVLVDCQDLQQAVRRSTYDLSAVILLNVTEDTDVVDRNKLPIKHLSFP
jgi:hypothetical protein